MDHRTPLKKHSVLTFEGLPCHIEEIIGQGSNAIVYKGWYPDQLNPDHRHYVLVKELFPYHVRGKIRRDENGCVVVDSEAYGHWRTHRDSFLAGNDIHLRLLADHPDFLGANLNSYACNGTLYSVLGYSGGRSLLSAFSDGEPDLRTITVRMLGILDALEAFHKSGYLHLDISPDNIMLVGTGERERIFLIDYNSARPVDSQDTSYLSFKAGYSAPEVETCDVSTIDFSSDLYSVAAVFFRSITGRDLTLEELLQSRAPDGSDSPLLENQPQTVINMVGKILKKGLHVLPGKRYRSIGQMRLAFRELLDRIDCVGVTHWALWESGRRGVEDLIRVNPSLRYLKDRSGLFPIRLLRDDSCTLADYLADTLSPEGRSGLILAQGGMGKTTMLLHTAMLQNRRYSASAPAVFYVSCSGWTESDANYIRSQILMSLRFKREMNSFDSAFHALQQLLGQPLKTKSGSAPCVLLLLDGLNEVRGDMSPLIREINELSAMAGVRIIAASRSEIPELNLETAALCPLEEDDVSEALGLRGLMIPQNETVFALLRTPLILSIYIQTGENDNQPDVDSEADLMQAYLTALLRKELRELPDNAPERWQIAAALQFVLPGIAAEEERLGSSLTHPQLLKVVQRCWKVVRSRTMRKIFPQWIGHSKDIIGGAKNEEEWYGLMIHDLLWQRLGLLMRQGDGGYRVFHQNIAGYLADENRDISRRIWKRTTLRGILASVAAVAVLAAVVWFANPLMKDYAMIATMGIRQTDNVSRLLQDAYDYWEDCLEINEKIYSRYTWAMDYVSTYTASGSWEDLLTARAACESAAREISQLEVPIRQLTKWEQFVLTFVGIDTVWLDVGDVENNIASTAGTLNYFATILKNDVFTQSTALTIPALMDNYRVVMKTEIQYLTTSTNYLLLQTGRYGLWQEIPQRFPTIGAHCGPWMDDEQALYDACNAILDEMEAAIAEMDDYFAASEYTLSVVQQALDTGDYTALAEEVCFPVGLTNWFPAPGFLENPAWRYLVVDSQSGQSRFIQPGESLERGIYDCFLVASPTAAENVNAYAAMLESWGFGVTSQWQTDSLLYVTIEGEGGGSLIIKWEPSQTVLYLNAPAGCLVPELYLLAALS